MRWNELGHLAFVLWAVATLTFLLFRLMPGDPTLNFISPTFSEEMRAALLHGFGLDRPLLEAIPDLFRQPAARRPRACRSCRTGRSATLLLDALPNTIMLTLVSLLAWPMRSASSPARCSPSAAAARWRRSRSRSALATRAAPEFWLGMLLLAAFAFQLGWFPTGGAVEPRGGRGRLRRAAAHRAISGGTWCCRR